AVGGGRIFVQIETDQSRRLIGRTDGARCAVGFVQLAHREVCWRDRRADPLLVHAGPRTTVQVVVAPEARRIALVQTAAPALAARTVVPARAPWDTRVAVTFADAFRAHSSRARVSAGATVLKARLEVFTGL